ncbi:MULTISPECIES: STAS domain-containing protein [unclassified Endozoicomonas]|uniref:STAS domain-containing protein n=1 Tax=unclassified Endozoicomonas TaxID=2644528 RepID=UPI0021489914|nr:MULTISPECIES: STAS domain-containing protein [unclassified Endozoicomonas]
MTTGKILFAKNDGTYVLKLVGEVRLTLCSSLEQMINEPDFTSVIIDLTDTDTIDSTSLGLLAKLSIQTKKNLGLVPVIISTKDDITRILLSMGFDRVFVIVKELEGYEKLNLNMHDIACDGNLEQPTQVRQVLDAHKVLMGLSEENREAFSELVKQLEQIQNSGKNNTKGKS